MHIITEAEYDDIVDRLATSVFDPMHPDSDIADTSLEVLDLALDGDQDEAREMLEEEVEYVVIFKHGLGHDGPLGQMEASTAGCILQHSSSAYSVGPSDVRTAGGESGACEMAALALQKDVRSEIYDRVRSAVGEKKQEA